jgi:two-component sensor histidine kinase
MVRLIRFLFFGLGFVPFSGLSQASKLDNSGQRLLLQLSSSFIQVVKELQVDIDSGLCVAAALEGLSRLPVLAEDIELGAVPAGWIDQNDPAAGKRLLVSSSGSEHTRLLLLLGAYYTFLPDVYPAEKDSAIGYLKMAELEAGSLHLETLRQQTLCLMEKYYLETNGIDKAMECLHRVTSQARLAGDKAIEAKAWAYAGIWYPFSFPTLPTRIGFMKKALELYLQEKNVTAAINTLQNIGYMSFASGKQLESEDASRQALRLADSIRYPYTHYISDLLALINTNKSFYTIAANYALRSVRTAEGTRDSLAYGYFYKRAGEIFSDISSENETDPSAIEYSDWFEKSIKWFMSRGKNEKLYFDVWRLSYMVGFNNKSPEGLSLIREMYTRYPPNNLLDTVEYECAIGTWYRLLGQLDSSRKYFQQARAGSDRLPVVSNYNIRLIILKGLGRIYFLMGDHARSRKYYQQLLDEPRLREIKAGFSFGALFDLYTMDSADSHYLSAIRYFRRYSTLKDSFYTAIHAKQIEELSVQYETDQKIMELGTLHSKSLLQQQQLKHAATQRKFIFAGIVAMWLILGLLYNRYRLKRKNSLLLEKQKAEIDNKNRQLEGLLTDKDELLMEKDELLESREWLLKELHHRVKNNLQIMMSLLNLQTLSLDNEEAVHAIMDSRNRLQAMSMIHQKLYQTKDMGMIDMPGFIGEFVSYLYNGMYKGASVRLALQLTPLQLDVAKAVPLALLLNEAITNVFKYAFSDPVAGRVNTLNITMRPVGGLIEITVKDNGKGLPPGFDPDNSSSLGVYLMRSLADQIDGGFSMTNDAGATVTVVFSPEVVVSSRRSSTITA